MRRPFYHHHQFVCFFVSLFLRFSVSRFSVSLFVVVFYFYFYYHKSFFFVTFCFFLVQKASQFVSRAYLAKGRVAVTQYILKRA